MSKLYINVKNAEDFNFDVTADWSTARVRTSMEFPFNPYIDNGSDSYIVQPVVDQATFERFIRYGVNVQTNTTSSFINSFEIYNFRIDDIVGTPYKRIRCILNDTTDYINTSALKWQMNFETIKVLDIKGTGKVIKYSTPGAYISENDDIEVHPFTTSMFTFQKATDGDIDFTDNHLIPTASIFPIMTLQGDSEAVVPGREPVFPTSTVPFTYKNSRHLTYLTMYGLACTEVNLTGSYDDFTTDLNDRAAYFARHSKIVSLTLKGLPADGKFKYFDTLFKVSISIGDSDGSLKELDIESALPPFQLADELGMLYMNTGEVPLPLGGQLSITDSPNLTSLKLAGHYDRIGIYDTALAEIPDFSSVIYFYNNNIDITFARNKFTEQSYDNALTWVNNVPDVLGQYEASIILGDDGIDISFLPTHDFVTILKDKGYIIYINGNPI